MKVLGIETSCDETSASVIEDGYNMLSNVTASSIDLHKPFGGVVPEIASRSHVEVIIPVIEEAFASSKTDWSAIDAIAVTYGPGLSGSLLIGVMTAKSLAMAQNKPLYAVNHVTAHTFASFITKSRADGYRLPKNQPEFPILSLIVSGGHTQLVLFKNCFDYDVLGKTTDDAVGEAFDKVAKIVGLPYPGGSSVSESAKRGDPLSVILPIAKVQGEYNFSFSGLKTAVLRSAQAMIGEDFSFPSKNLPERLSEAQKANISASFQHIAVKTLLDKTVKACQEYQPASVVVAGGVAANQALREQLNNALPTKPIFPDIKLCTDNGAMIAVYGYYMASSNQPKADPFTLVPNSNLSM
jgi:N6-L-threonylcarbamoyladenine synthase